jgi:hypothetical protein
MMEEKSEKALQGKEDCANASQLSKSPTQSLSDTRDTPLAGPGAPSSESRDSITAHQSPIAATTLPSRSLNSNGFANPTIKALSWTPKACRYDPANPPRFGYGLNVLFALVGGKALPLFSQHELRVYEIRCRPRLPLLPIFTVRGLGPLVLLRVTKVLTSPTDNQPILYKIAETFDVSFERASSIATLMQAGYAAGLVLICPLGDVFPRRPFILSLVGVTALLASFSKQLGPMSMSRKSCITY